MLLMGAPLITFRIGTIVVVQQGVSQLASVLKNSDYLTFNPFASEGNRDI